MLFPGQGSQYVGMLRELACRFPAMQSVLAQWNEASGSGGKTLSDRIYPPSTYREDQSRRQHEELRDTRFAQPAIGAVSLGLLRILDDFRVRPELVGGHSFGELTALHAAGRIDDASLAALAFRRGSLMAACAGADDPGGMLAVSASYDQVAEIIQANQLDLVIANKNAPRQHVLSGPAGEVERASSACSKAGISSRVLEVSAAFHSRFVGQARTAFRAGLESVDLKPGTIPVFANATGGVYPEDSRQARDLLADQLDRPVEFVNQIEAMYRQGARTFLEVGPDSKLTGLVNSILSGRDSLALAVDASRGTGHGGNLGDLAVALAKLAAAGYPVDLAPWDLGFRAPESPSPKQRLTVKVCGANAGPARPPAREVGASRKAESDPPVDLIAPSRPHEPVRSSDPTLPRGLARRADLTENGPVEWTMNLPKQNPIPNSAPATNGQAAHSLPPSTHGSQVAERGTPPVSPQRHLTESDVSGLAQAIQQSQENLLILQRLAEQTASLHRQFLEGQAATQQTFQSLLEHQRRLTTIGLAAKRIRRLPDHRASSNLSHPD